MPSSVKKPVEESTLLNTVGANLTENSTLVKTVVSGSKNLIVPVSKLIDYAAVSLVAVCLYKLLLSYL